VRETAVREQLEAAGVHGKVRTLNSLNLQELKDTLSAALKDGTVAGMSTAEKDQFVRQVLNKLAGSTPADGAAVMRALTKSPLLGRQLRDADDAGLLQRPLDEHLDAELLRPRPTVPGVASDGGLEVGEKYRAHGGAAKFVNQLQSGLLQTLLGSKPASFCYNNSLQLLNQIAADRTVNPKFALVMDGEEALVFNKAHSTEVIKSHPHVFGLPQNPSPAEVDGVFNKLVADLSKPGAIEDMWDNDELKLGVLLGYGESNARKFIEEGRARVAKNEARLAALGPQEMNKAFSELTDRMDRASVRPFNIISWDSDETRAMMRQSKQDVVAINEKIESLHADALETSPNTFKADVMIDHALETLYLPR
jgi:hypothetical protein